MKKLHSTCEEYCNYSKSTALHDIKFINNIHSFDNLQNIILTGPNGIGKYTQALQIIKKFSPSNLKYERKMSFESNKEILNFLVSDIHIEVDFDMLGCHSKLLWHEIYNNYIDILMSKSNKCGIILCKNFQNIHSELHEIFYSYINNNNINKKYNLKYIILTTSSSFIYNNILFNFDIHSLGRPSKSKYQKLSSNKITSNNIYNIKNIKLNVNDKEPHIFLCDIIINYISDHNNIHIPTLRDHIYNLLIYALDISECIWYINEKLSIHNTYKQNINDILMQTISFLKLYNNNYRPIYHLEKYFIYLINIIYGSN